jgi:hypothetical protein
MKAMEVADVAPSKPNWLPKFERLSHPPERCGVPSENRFQPGECLDHPLHWDSRPSGQLGPEWGDQEIWGNRTVLMSNE